MCETAGLGPQTALGGFLHAACLASLLDAVLLFRLRRSPALAWLSYRQSLSPHLTTHTPFDSPCHRQLASGRTRELTSESTQIAHALCACVHRRSRTHTFRPAPLSVS